MANTIPSVHLYQPPSDQGNFQHYNNDSISIISHSRCQSLVSAISAEGDDNGHIGLLNDHRHTRNFSKSSREEQYQDRSHLSNNHHSQAHPSENQKRTPIQPPQPILPGLPTPATHPTPKPRRESTRYYSGAGWDTQIGYEWEIQGEYNPGHSTGLKIWNSWSNAKTEWRVGSRERVLKYYVGGPLLVLFVLAIVLVIVWLIVYFAKWT
ncbi:uncharacterized protein N7498_000453 [Penicillium cinerascens]|uniref:Uncharacterized protein n=1 Tax=Penicillium cinerascens TaxID=70096 RepID=A0A9W9NEF9_9EURO|nr:uncharacterized protein N7498_000453 [Penicillium cinerascens]KAJ5218354.1 hypothetical protein N7498_000453 [Penicillium cinerascens]